MSTWLSPVASGLGVLASALAPAAIPSAIVLVPLALLLACTCACAGFCAGLFCSEVIKSAAFWRTVRGALAELAAGAGDPAAGAVVVRDRVRRLQAFAA